MPLFSKKIFLISVMCAFISLVASSASANETLITDNKKDSPQLFAERHQERSKLIKAKKIKRLFKDLTPEQQVRFLERTNNTFLKNYLAFSRNSTHASVQRDIEQRKNKLRGVESNRVENEYLVSFKPRAAKHYHKFIERFSQKHGSTYPIEVIKNYEQLQCCFIKNDRQTSTKAK